MSMLINSMAFPAPPPSYTYDPSVGHNLTPTGLVVMVYRSGTAMTPISKLSKGPILIHCHGNAEDLGTASYEAGRLSKGTGAEAVVAFDYPGYGRSGGRASEGGVLRAVEEVARWTEEHLGVGPGGTLVHGTSVGSVPAVHLLKEKEGYRGLILQSPLASGSRVLFGGNPMWGLFDSIFGDNIRKMRRVDSPTLIIHGDKDEVIDVRNAEALAAVAKTLWRKVIVKGARHNNVEYTLGEEYFEIIDDFISSVM